MLKKITFLLLLSFSYLFSNNFEYLQSGDIIFRKEESFLSDLFSNIDSFEYSHIGILKIENNSIYVYHMERTTDKEKDLKKETISKFLSNSKKYSVIRFKKEISQNNLSVILEKYEKNLNLKFDMNFALNNGDNNLYCSEFVNEIYKKLIHKDIFLYLYKVVTNKGISLKSIYTNEIMFKKIL